MHLRNHVEGRPGDPDAIRRLSRADGEVERSTQRMSSIALYADRYDFAVRVELKDGRPVARTERPAASDSDD